jgi:hypothetical protein
LVWTNQTIVCSPPPSPHRFAAGTCQNNGKHPTRALATTFVPSLPSEAPAPAIVAKSHVLMIIPCLGWWQRMLNLHCLPSRCFARLSTTSSKLRVKTSQRHALSLPCSLSAMLSLHRALSSRCEPCNRFVVRDFEYSEEDQQADETEKHELQEDLKRKFVCPTPSYHCLGS